MPILNYTTKIDSYKTVAEIQQLLAKKGVKKMIIDNDEKGNPFALMFFIEWKGMPTSFSLPCNFTGVFSALKKQNVQKSLCTEEQAMRVGWRIIKDWVEAQMAIVEADLASMQEIFLPYAITSSGARLFEHIDQNVSKHLLQLNQ